MFMIGRWKLFYPLLVNSVNMEGYMTEPGEFDYSNFILRKIEQSHLIGKRIIEQKHLLNSISRACSVIIECLTSGRKILFAGNGGSAADAQHMAAEFVGKFYVERDPLSAIALNTNNSIISAIANDYSFDMIFSRQVRAIGRSGDIIIGITTSGNSRNIFLALSEAKKMGMNTIGLTGSTGGAIKDVAEILINIPSSDTPRIQESHIMVGHIICEIVEKEIFSRKDKELEMLTGNRFKK